MQQVQAQPRVAVLAGGDSDERTISLASGRAVQNALLRRNFTAIHIDPALVDVEGMDWSHFDIAFIALHGRFGEDGVVQSILDRAGVPYTGSNAETSRLSFTKSATKESLGYSGVATPIGRLIHFTNDHEQIHRAAADIAYPLVVKPDAQGSSLGVTWVNNPDDLIEATQFAFRFDSCALIETALTGHEWTVGFCDGQNLPPLRIESASPVFDYDSKYTAGPALHVFDDGPESRRVVELARQAQSALKTRGLARIDIRCDAQGIPHVLEVNTIPGLTEKSLVPKMAARMGISFESLCEWAIRAAKGNAEPLAPNTFQQQAA